jgi:hypothetical protein
MTETVRRASLIISFLDDVRLEFNRVTARHGDFNSAHEGWAVILEEVDELWDEVRKKRANRDLANMRVECVQIAAASMRFALAICTRRKKET